MIYVVEVGSVMNDKKFVWNLSRQLYEKGHNCNMECENEVCDVHSNQNEICNGSSHQTKFEIKAAAVRE